MRQASRRHRFLTRRFGLQRVRLRIELQNVNRRLPSTEATDRGRKLQTFARFGVAEYWIIEPDAPWPDTQLVLSTI